VVHSRDDKGIGMAHKIIPPNNQPQVSLTTIGQYWLGPNKLSDQSEMPLKSFYGILKRYLIEFSIY